MTSETAADPQVETAALPSEPDSKKSVNTDEPSDFIIGHNPEKVKSKFLLIVTRPQPFALDTVMFAVDSFEPIYLENDTEHGKDRALMAYEAYDKKGAVVVRFPVTYQYLLVNRSAYKPMFGDESTPRPTRSGPKLPGVYL